MIEVFRNHYKRTYIKLHFIRLNNFFIALKIATNFECVSFEIMNETAYFVLSVFAIT